MKNAARTALVLAFLAVGAFAQANPELAELAGAAREEAGVPAIGLMVARKGEEPRIAVAGVRFVGEAVAVTAGDKWHWGSITKSMTATLVARLVEKGAVSWDDTIESRLGEIAPDTHPDYLDVTFRHLLTHRSGLAAEIPISRFKEFGQAPEDPIADRAKWVRIALSQEPDGPMETTYLYSNNGYIVAGAMLEAATGRSWEELMTREVFDPLGINNAGFGPPRGDGPLDEPRGHVPRAEVDVPAPIDADNPAALGPAGRVHMPLDDMARYLRAHVSRDEKFLSAESFDALHSAPLGGFYGMGWVVTDPVGLWHNGSNTMWYSEVSFDLETGTAAAVVVNDGDTASVRPRVTTLLS